MPTNYIKKLAGETGLSVKKLEGYWERAKDIAADKFEPDSERYWKYVMGIVKHMTASRRKDRVEARIMMVTAANQPKVFLGGTCAHSRWREETTQTL